MCRALYSSLREKRGGLGWRVAPLFEDVPFGDVAIEHTTLEHTALDYIALEHSTLRYNNVRDFACTSIIT